MTADTHNGPGTPAERSDSDPPSGEHLEDEQISGYLDRDGTVEELHSMESHLASCHPCAERLDAMRASDNLVAQAPAEPASAGRMKRLIITNALSSLDNKAPVIPVTKPSSIVTMAAAAATTDARARTKRGRRAALGSHRSVLTAGIAAGVIVVAGALALALVATGTQHSVHRTVNSSALASGNRREPLSETSKPRSIIPTGAPIFGNLQAANNEGAIKAEIRQVLIAARNSRTPGSQPGLQMFAPALSARTNARQAAINAPAGTGLSANPVLNCLPAAVQMAPPNERLAIVDNTTYMAKAAIAVAFVPSASAIRNSRQVPIAHLVVIDASTCHIVLSTSIAF